jgi:hypothetical protein
VQFQEDELVHEHIYWDQASVLVRLGLLDPDGLPIAGAETARKVLHVSLPSNTLMNSVAVARLAHGYELAASTTGTGMLLRRSTTRGRGRRRAGLSYILARQ